MFIFTVYYVPFLSPSLPPSLPLPLSPLPLLSLPSDPPNVTTLEPREVIINQTQEANFTCTAYGIPTPSIQWINVSSGSVVTPVPDLIDIVDTTLTSSTLESVLVFHSGYKTDESVYTCIGSNNITNIINSPEEDNVTLLVQGKEKREGREGVVIV